MGLHMYPLISTNPTPILYSWETQQIHCARDRSKKKQNEKSNKEKIFEKNAQNIIKLTLPTKMAPKVEWSAEVVDRN